MKSILSPLMALGTVSTMAIAVTSCIDSSYDLSDMDPTVQVTVKDLTVPVNLGPVTLHDVLDLEEGDDIKEMNGEYVVFKEGSFSSTAIRIDKVDVKASPVEPSTVDVSNQGVTPEIPDGLVIPTGSEVYSYLVEEPSLSEFQFNDDNIDYRIKGLDYINVDWSFNFNFSISDPDKNFIQYGFRNIRLQVPEGIVFGGNAKDWVVSPTELALPDVMFAKGASEYSLSIPVAAIDFKRMEASGVGSFVAGATRKEPGKFQIKGEIGLKSGEILAVTGASITTGSHLQLQTSPSLTSIIINSVTGQIAYNVEDLDVSDVDLSSLPDFLSGDETNLILSNPQLYLSATNPVGKFGVGPTTGLELIPVRYNAQGKEVLGTPAVPSQDIVIGSNNGDGPYKFCLAPEPPQEFYPGFDGAELIPYPALRTVLSGEGLPKKLRVNFIDPSIDGTVEDFTLGTNLPKVEGKYVMYCPLSLGQGSKIVYASDETGWGEDVQKVTIKTLTVTAVCHNDLPFDVTFRNCYPLDAYGKRINNVNINEVTVRSGENQQINIEVTGEFTRCDGIHFEAVATQTSDTPLRPTTELRLTDLRAKVSGYYIDKIDNPNL